MGENQIRQLLKQIPGVDAVLQWESVGEALLRHPRKIVLDAIREELGEVRNQILQSEGALLPLDPQELARAIARRADRLSAFTLRPVVNATGIVIHTNLGRSLLPEDALTRLQTICRGYNNLEYDLQRGERGSRYVHAESILCELTGSQAALVVNNNAGAVFLALNTLAAGREVVVSRGQLVEIGGSFRIPDVMSASGAILKEVGTTNRTHLFDYAAAISERTAMLMKVHTSNFRIVGFTKEVSLGELAALGQERGLPVVEDLGSGCLIDLAPFGLRGETTVQQTVRAGADLVTFSGDKLLGGPQAGILVGRKELIEKCRKNPITRALRVDKMTLAVLETTLRLYRDEHQALEKIPALRMIALSPEELNRRACELALALQGEDPENLLRIEVRPGFSQVGGGSLPAQDLPTSVVAVQSASISANRIEEFLRRNDPPIIGRIESDRFLMDVRTLIAGETEIIAAACKRMIDESVNR
ncbi:MAG: L-seryl-tRNA(Sec) selenium transferase [Syntrophobacteraceae bacterium]|nr:L-seryl-tRNA(Sec) selenium transferase [Syntrophobacteraceae bacterium]